jgi:hypothetical protein
MHPTERAHVKANAAFTEGAFRQSLGGQAHKSGRFRPHRPKSRAGEMLKERPFGGPPSWNAQCKVLKSRAPAEMAKNTELRGHWASLSYRCVLYMFFERRF